MVETGAGGFHQPDFSALAEDLIPAEDDTYDLGAADKRWAYLYAVIAILTSTIGFPPAPAMLATNWNVNLSVRFKSVSSTVI